MQMIETKGCRTFGFVAANDSIAVNLIVRAST